MRVGEYGVKFAFSVGFNLTGFTDLSIVFTKPDGTTLTVTNPAVTAPNVNLETTAGLFPAGEYALYTFANGDVNQSGNWCAYVIYDGNGEHLISDPADFTVDPLGCQD